MMMDYDYRITIYRKAVEPGRISISFWGFKGDTLECGSLVLHQLLIPSERYCSLLLELPSSSEKAIGIFFS